MTRITLEGLYRPCKKDISKIARTFVNAFMDYPLHMYVLPDKESREKKLNTYFKMIVRYGLRFGDMYATSENAEGVAIYLHPESGPMTNWRWVQCGALGFMLAFGSAALKRYDRLLVSIDELKKKHAPGIFTYLAYLAVEPAFQNKGHANALVKPMLEHLARNKRACYLETFKPINEAIYHRLGFQTVEKYAISGTNLTAISLLREPQ